MRRLYFTMCLGVSSVFAGDGEPLHRSLRYHSSDESPQVLHAMTFAETHSTQVSRVVISHCSDRLFADTQRTYIITHGIGGTAVGDRFHQLMDAICNAIPEANVLIIDWSKDSWRTRGYLQLPSPWDVAKNIDPVAMEAVTLLKTLKMDPARITFIGESFGTCVNARIAEALGGRGRILAFNPPNELSGYKTPDLRFCSDVAWSFQTYSMYDGQSPIADVGFFLETPENATVRDQHVFGVEWLAAQVRSGDVTWILPELILPEPATETFDAIATLSGEILNVSLPRYPSINGTSSEPSEMSMASIAETQE